jgi:hypothetical protein
MTQALRMLCILAAVIVGTRALRFAEYLSRGVR